MEYIECSIEDKSRLYNYINKCNYRLVAPELSNEQIREKIRNIIHPIFFIEKYVDDMNGGITYPVIRLVEISSSLKGFSYAYVLMHEYIHVAYLYGDESYVDFLTVKYLWESDSVYLQKAACWTVKQKIIYDNGDEYDCTTQLVEYFQI